jgi:hypothetical protein
MFDFKSLQKSPNMIKKIILKNEIWVSKNAKSGADFETMEKVTLKW